MKIYSLRTKLEKMYSQKMIIKKKQATNFHLVILVLSVGIFPPLAINFLNTTSMALGLLLSTFLVFFYFVNEIKVLKKVGFRFVYLLIFLMLYSIVQFLFVGPFWGKSYASILLLILVVMGALLLSKMIISKEYFPIKVMKNIFWVLLFILFLTIVLDFKLGVFFYNHHKTVFPFGEPSHFALFFGPFFILYLYSLNRVSSKLLIILTVLISALLIQSTTLLVYVVMALVLFIRFNVSSLFFVIPVLLYGTYFIMNEPYYVSRFVLSSDSTNLTALVYLQGLMDAYNALVNTRGLGLGFQMLGTQPPSEVLLQIQSVLGQGTDGGGVNRFDGGFVAAKLVAEFGIVGLILLLLYLYIFLEVFIKLKKYIYIKTYQLDGSYIFSLVFIYSAFVEIFVRGVGYFSPSLFLFFTALFVYFTFKKRRLNAPLVS